MPRDCLRIIESKSKVRNSRNKPVVAKVSASTSTPGISSEVAELKEMVKALLLQKKYNLHRLLLPVKRLRKVVLLAVVLIPTKLVQPLLAMFIEIISKNMSLKQPQLIQPRKHRIEPRIKIKFDTPGFIPPVQNNHMQNQGNNQNRYNQNRGNFNQAPAYQPPVNQGQVYRPQVVQPPAYQAPAYQAPAPQIQGYHRRFS
ncbi:hypothetical protein Tco_0595570 [Tanacetum coccineum]